VTARRAIAWSVAPAACVALCACSTLGAPATDRTRSSEVAQAETAREYPSPPPPRQSAAAGAASPAAAIEAFAGTYINWNALNVSARMHALAARSIGQARSAMALAAAETAHDYELMRGGVANSGTVEAIAPMVRSPDRYLVVTRERTTAANTTAYQGLEPSWHVAIATVAQLGPGAWVVSGWQPES